MLDTKKELRRRDDVSLKTPDLDRIAIDLASHKLLDQLLDENPKLKEILCGAQTEQEALAAMESWAASLLERCPQARIFLENERPGREAFEALTWRDYAVIRLSDYIKNAGREYEDLNLRGEIAVSNPFKMLWLAMKSGKGGAKSYFFEDMIHLFRQLSGASERCTPSRKQVKEWMQRWPSGLDPRIAQLREKNKTRILNLIVDQIEKQERPHPGYKFEPGATPEQKYAQALEWWDDWHFHLSFAVRSPDMLNEMLDRSLDPDTMKLLYSAEKVGIPFFVNPYYLSLLNVDAPDYAVGADLAIRDYVLYSKQLIAEFGHIVAWEKEDQVEPGKPNAAGWLLPTSNNVHRRYPEVAILIPDTVGRACGGLCQSCQRMFDFQSGHLNFDLDKLQPKETWPVKLRRLMDYFENDSQLRDILITGGDALMSSDKSLAEVLEAVYQMALRKIEVNKSRPEGEKYAELVRVRLGTRLPVYIPQRITGELTKILADFKSRASEIGVQQFLVQTHFESPMEITPEASVAVGKLVSAGWTVTNQHVLTTASSRRGHTAKLRADLNAIGALGYYTFTVKGYMENQHNFATNARAVQEQMEEKCYGLVAETFHDRIRDFPLHAEKMTENIAELLNDADLPFLSTDRNILNLPGVGKSLTFRVIGLTRYGRRILEFDHDVTRAHSPVVNTMGKVAIIESKPVGEYLRHLESIGEDVGEYQSVWGYSMGETEPRLPIYDYPEYEFKTTREMTNLEL